MEIAKNNRMNSLFAFYAPLLTDKQRQYLELYYGDDYSLGEIAEDYHVSRQAVYDNIRRTEKILEDYEQKLHLYQNYERENDQVDALQHYIDAHYGQDQKLQQLLQAVLTTTEE
ncbi:hypothetical protein IV38_GL000516 [Lactobacillus selangorensis]|uniref:UPF0122 protein IV38_GL000516 n=1 Tax=Lactobacillus selangorensis TaxID=81857 RepID=A0A0R2FZA6_9LACO|nr:putative DNA-binding protein [Lactobacillus selangorensis]KRN29629.1 hypothetical protein IV38_GL000516 [Lactobacillus selangorensis]KRN33842.1 hypothetical protein IV40_GL000152 [Lactobacillus selangorensis]